MSKLTPSPLILSVAIAATFACGPDLHGPDAVSKDAERIDRENDPANFELQMLRRFQDLPASGSSLRSPFPSNWWPMARGGIAQRWNGNDASPAEKYDRLVHPGQIRTVQLTQARVNWRGEWVNPYATPETFVIGPTTQWELTNHGNYGETLPDTWWGHCNGWASYVLNEDEPTRPVSVRMDNGRVVECTAGSTGCVRFELGDINALGAEIYWHDASRIVGRRCEQQGSQFTFDRSGRISSVECRDGNPAALHIITTNMIGVMRRPYIVDLNADFQVWNYPVYRYELTQNREISLGEALAAVEAPWDVTRWIYNDEAVRFARVTMRAWIVEDAIPPSTQPAGNLLDQFTTIETYEYILEMDAAGTIIGGEWVGVSKQRHPDFVWYSFSNSSYGTQDDDASDGDNTALRYSIFKQILTLAQQGGQPPPPPPPPGDVIRVARTPQISIPDNNANGITDSANVSNNVTAAKVEIEVRIRHTWRGDLTVRLEREGQSYLLVNREGADADNVVATFEVAALAGRAASGVWTLRVADHESQDFGVLESWAVLITPNADEPPPPPPPPPPSDEPLVVTSTPRRSIPDNNSAGIQDVITVRESFAATAVLVSVDITHTYQGDLTVRLVRSGRMYVLHQQTGGGTQNLRGTWELRDLVGADGAGTWTLQVYDSAAYDVGTLNSWSVSLGRGSGGGTPGPITRELSLTPNISIPDNNTQGIRSTINVNEDLIIEEVRVELDVSHTYISDLRINLAHGIANQVIHDHEGGSGRDIRRAYETRAFGGTNARGAWTLSIVDLAAYDVGRLNSWKIVIVGRRP